MGPSRRTRAAGAAALLLAIGGCAEINTVADVVFPSAVPGLPHAASWTSLPLRRWLTEDGIEPVAVSICFRPACAEPAVAALLKARGKEADALRRAALDPSGLVAAAMPARSPARLRRASARTTATRITEAGRPALLVRIARADGSREAGGIVAAIEGRDATTILVVVAPSGSSARLLARAILPHLGG